MSPIDLITYQDYNFPMDLGMTSEPDLVKTSNVETKFSPTETKMLSQKIQLYFQPIPMILISPTNITTQKIQKVNYT